MKRAMVWAMCMVMIVGFSACSKKKAAPEEGTEAINLDTLETANVTTPAGANATTPTVNIEATAPQSALAPTAEAPVVTGAPDPRQIQTALKNAGLYAGSIDGKLGPKSKAAVKQFQTAQGLTVTGKVNPKTWAKLSAYLSNSAPATVEPTPAAPVTPAAAATTHTAKSKTRKASAHRDVTTPPGHE